MKQIHARMIRTCLIQDGFASSRLIAFCAGLEQKNLSYCVKLLLNTENPNSFSWNVAIRGCLESENAKDAVDLYIRMLRSDGSRPDNYTYPLLFKVCACLLLNFTGHQILGHVLKFGFDQDMFVHNSCIHMMVAIGELELARKMFDESSVRNLVSWNSLINGYARCGKVMEAIGIYREMMEDRVIGDEVTMIGVVSSCAQLRDLKLGREFHRRIGESGLVLTIRLANALMDMYVKCGDLEAAKEIFDNMEKNTVVSWTTMVIGYAKHGFLDTAKRLFRTMPEKNVVTWNAMIGSYVKAKQSKEAIVLFNEMQTSNVKPDRVTLIHCLSACSQLGALDMGIWIHHYIKKHNFFLDVVLGTSLVDMYAKCGNITKALLVFDEMPGKNSLTWTSIIGGLALHGNANDAVYYFSKMIDVGLIPDEITYLGVLSACCHGGLVEEGKKYFAQMKQRFNLFPEVKHYSCMVDLLGRAGLLEEADELIQSMPIEADAAVWGALFFACRIHGNVSMGERAALKLLELDPNDSGIYVLLANMYREANKLEEARTVRKMMRERGVEKVPGSSAIEVNGVVSEFIAKDKMHPQSAQVYDCLVQLTRQLESADCIFSIQV
ncbi:Pentatricopeptide repeat (PPR) superfamily protein [Euphorbia peplus]|nr:Pentatricopeptide repeat (PPR) superfamily protein [Euphorbia peplus]